MSERIAGPTVRLAHCGPPEALAAGLVAPSIRLALGGTHTNDKVQAMADPATCPALLVSFVYLDPFLKNQARYSYRDWVMDSGAFSAHKLGTVIDLQKYIDKCQQLTATDPTLTEVFSLDVIGDWRASEKNTERMWAQGVEAIPTYHVGEPLEVLLAMAKSYPKIALGGAVGYKQKDAWAKQCFAKIWPKKIHGLGFGSEASLMMLPWHSVDATNWEIGPCKFGRWAAFGQMSVRGSNQDLRAEVLHYLDIENRARGRWRKEMAQLDGLGPKMRLVAKGNSHERGGQEACLRNDQPTVVGPTMRLVANANAGRETAKASAFAPPPTVRLALASDHPDRIANLSGKGSQW